jgi:general secretion pathway protein F
MPLYRYRAQDAQGRDVEGSLNAADVATAQMNLVRRGLRLFDLSEASATPSAAVMPTSPGPVQAPQARSNYEPNRRVANARPTAIDQNGVSPAAGLQSGNVRINTVQDPPLAVRRTKRGNPKALSFIFSQLASFFNAGYNPAQALETVANQQPNLLYRDSLLEASRSTQEGARFSKVLDRYPDLYPKPVVGMVRAGEMGGFLPEAVNAVAEQSASARKLAGWLRVFGWWTGIHLVLIVPGWLMVKFAEDDLDAQFKSGGTANTAQVFLNSVGKELLWPVGPITLVAFVGLWLLGRWLFDSSRSELHDRLMLIIPAVGKRARSESLAIFAWTLSMVSRVGIPPKTAFELAVGAMPNQWMQHQLRIVQARMQDGTRLSEAVAGTRLLPDEYAAILQTGEMVGDVSGALMNVSSATTEEFQRNDKLALARIGCWGVLVMIIATAILMFFVIGSFYPHLIKAATAE